MEQRKFLKLSSVLLMTVGLILLFSPKDIFPDFYKPIFMGYVALASPLLIYLPKLILKKSTPQKRYLILEMRSVIAFSLTVNIAGELGLFQLYKFGFQYDKFAHFIVSMLFAFILAEALKAWEPLSPWKIACITILIVFSSGILWEVFEATSDFLFQTHEWGVYGQHLAWDTFGDIVFNTLGAFAGVIVFKIPKGKTAQRV